MGCGPSIPPSPTTIRAVICGRVQGVGFRFFAVKEAASRGITGFVRNMECGEKVEVLASGDTSELEDFLGMLRKGPPGAKVTEMTTHQVETAPAYSDFTVLH
jgi:acylphosphatase